MIRTGLTGKKLLRWEAKSNLDVRGIVAIALNEEFPLNCWGYPLILEPICLVLGLMIPIHEYANNFNDEVAVVGTNPNKSSLKQKTKPSKFKMTRLKSLQNGTLNPTDGGVYFTDTTGSGKDVQKPCKKLDAFIDEHGGTPKAPEQTTGKTRDGGGVTSK